MDAYNEAHLYVAAIRLLQHRQGTPPTLEEACQLLTVSVEEGGSVYRNLKKLGIVEIMEDPFSVRISVADHLAIEKISREEPEENSLAKELEKFQSKKKNINKEVESLQAEIEKKKKDMFADIEAKFKKEMGK